MIISKKPFFLPLALLMAVCGSAAAEQSSLELSWAGCVREALAGNPGLKAKKLTIDQ
mgnify:CR=1 FL=1